MSLVEKRGVLKRYEARNTQCKNNIYSTGYKKLYEILNTIV